MTNTRTNPRPIEDAPAATAQLSDDEQRLVDRINQRAAAARPTKPAGLIHRLLTTPLIGY